MAGTRKGTCKGCGQAQIVPADNDVEADKIATERCTCPEGKEIRAKNRLMQNIDDICGEGCKRIGMDPVSPRTIERIKEAAELVHGRKMDKAVFSIDGTLITIIAKTKYVTVTRKRVLNIEKQSEIGEPKDEEH